MKIGIIGAGYVAQAITVVAVEHGHEVMLSNSRGPESLFSACAMFGCEAGTIDEAAKFGDIVVASITLKHFRAVPVEPLIGKVVIDTMNYYPDRDGAILELTSKRLTESELLAAHLPRSKVVKGFNAIMATELERDAKREGAVNRRALPLAGNDPEAKKVLADLYNEFGYDPFVVGNLSESWRFQPGTPVYCTTFGREWMRKALAAAVR